MGGGGFFSWACRRRRRRLLFLLLLRVFFTPPSGPGYPYCPFCWVLKPPDTPFLLSTSKRCQIAHSSGHSRLFYRSRTCNILKIRPAYWLLPQDFWSSCLTTHSTDVGYKKTSCLSGLLMFAYSKTSDWAPPHRHPTHGAIPFCFYCAHPFPSFPCRYASSAVKEIKNRHFSFFVQMYSISRNSDIPKKKKKCNHTFHGQIASKVAKVSGIFKGPIRRS